jgi:hypothetical protein
MIRVVGFIVDVTYVERSVSVADKVTFVDRMNCVVVDTGASPPVPFMQVTRSCVVEASTC